jgi:tRNA (adenine37-N6)-methyltransferase
MSQYKFTSIGTIHSCYKEKFGIPRQPALVASPATIEINSPYSQQQAFRELETFSHIWVVFIFHGISNSNWKPTVRPPRLGGNHRIGVFASRSMFRPNPIGLSVVELINIEYKGNKTILNIIGGDFLDATPVLDIKPYIPYADSIDTLKAGYAAEKPEVKLNVNFSAAVKTEIKKSESKYPRLKDIIVEILQLDPRPAYQEMKQTKNEFAIKLYDYDLKWQIENEQVMVTSLTLLD